MFDTPGSIVTQHGNIPTVFFLRLAIHALSPRPLPLPQWAVCTGLDALACDRRDRFWSNLLPFVLVVPEYRNLIEPIHAWQLLFLWVNIVGAISFFGGARYTATGGCPAQLSVSRPSGSS